MCSPIKCSKCHKLSFVGCGNHLHNLFGDKKPNQLCHCNPKIIEYLKNIHKTKN